VDRLCSMVMVLTLVDLLNVILKIAKLSTGKNEQFTCKS